MHIEIQRINRNILECKVMNRFSLFSISFVLIETYWNVKSQEKLVILGMALGINRNILECKEKRPEDILDSFYGINRNILECKVSVPSHYR